MANVRRIGGGALSEPPSYKGGRMKGVRTAQGTETPDYIAQYDARLRAAGIEAVMPTARGDLEPPDPLELSGRPLSDIIRELREGG